MPPQGSRLACAACCEKGVLALPMRRGTGKGMVDERQEQLPATNALIPSGSPASKNLPVTGHPREVKHDGHLLANDAVEQGCTHGQGRAAVREACIGPARAYVPASCRVDAASHAAASATCFGGCGGYRHAVVACMSPGLLSESATHQTCPRWGAPQSPLWAAARRAAAAGARRARRGPAARAGRAARRRRPPAAPRPAAPAACCAALPAHRPGRPRTRQTHPAHRQSASGLHGTAARGRARAGGRCRTKATLRRVQSKGNADGSATTLPACTTQVPP